MRECSAKIRQILTVGEFAVDLDVVDNRVSGILVDHALGALLEFLAVGIGPPVAQITLSVELAALVVKRVGEFVPIVAPVSP